MRVPTDNGLGLFGGQFTVALGGDEKQKPPSGKGKRPPGNGALGKPLPPIIGPRLGPKLNRPAPAPKSGSKVRA